eukprot:6191586-Pleurochrysis_carterae.AAC.2
MSLQPCMTVSFHGVALELACKHQILDAQMGLVYLLSTRSRASASVHVVSPLSSGARCPLLPWDRATFSPSKPSPTVDGVAGLLVQSRDPRFAFSRLSERKIPLLATVRIKLALWFELATGHFDSIRPPRISALRNALRLCLAVSQR